MTVPRPTRIGALVTAAQTGEVPIGPYATAGIINDLIRDGLGEAIIGTGPDQGKLIGFRINDRGHKAVRLMRDTIAAADAANLELTA